MKRWALAVVAVGALALVFAPASFAQNDLEGLPTTGM